MKQQSRLPDVWASRSSNAKTEVYNASMAIAFAQTKASGWLINLDASSITLNKDASCYGLEGFSQVKIAYQFATVLPNLLSSMAGGTDLTAQACYTNH
ncbi:pilus assembly protein [Rhizobium sp. BR 362]|uniref:pilus assembly protein n=1 Tax=Rhizobium sp. BR 362 TaxID=3040670 RepID=UPI002F402B38